jgi:hypothetical protein
VPSEDGKYPPLVATAAEDRGVQLDPVADVLGAEIHYTVDNSKPTLESPTFEPGLSESLQIDVDTTVKWIVVDDGNIVGPVGSQFFDIAEATDVTPAIVKVVPATVSGAVDVTFSRLADAASYRVRTYTGDSVDVATGVRVGLPAGIVQPADATVTEVTRRITGLTNGTIYKFTVAARFGTQWSGESPLSEAVAPEGAPKSDAGADQSVLRGREFVIDGSASVKATSYKWTQIRPGGTGNGGFPQDPALDLDPALAGTQSTTVAGTEPALTLTFPLLTTPTSDHNLLFRLTTTHIDGTTKSDLVEIKGQADTVTAEEVRWRAGDEIGGTGSQEGATLTLLNGGPTGAVIGQPVVGTGEWAQASGATGLLNGTIYVWSNYGYTGTITTTN